MTNAVETRAETMSRNAARARQAAALAKTAAADASAERPKSTRQADEARAFAIGCARIAAEDHCEDVVVLDLRGVSPICDFFVIATGTSDRQMRAVCDHIETMAAEVGDKPYGIAGYDEASWIVADYVDVVAHLFEADLRAYYDLESLWGDRPQVDWAG